MPRIARSCIDQIQRQVSLYDVVSQVVSLKKSGRQFRGLSPFSNEKTPSFYIDPDKNVFYCYSTSQGGDVIRFVQLYENLNFGEAIEALAERYNIPISYDGGDSASYREERSLRKTLLEIHEEACAFFHTAFQADRKDSETIRKYWVETRHFTPNLATEFKIGYAPVEERKLAEHLVGKGFSVDVLKKCGLFFFREGENDARRFHERFRGRLMIPIRNIQGNVIAFTARQTCFTPEDDPAHDAKYVNSPETSLFHKSDVLFGLDRARRHIADSGTFVMVEGQLDTLRCWEHDIKTALSPQGTAITESQLMLVKRYCDRIDCLLDGDEAGGRAAMRMLPVALRMDIEVRFLALPDGHDPDSLLREGGADAYRQLTENAQSAMTFSVKSLLPEKNPSAQAKSKAFGQILEILSECDSEVARRDYRNQAARLIGIDPAASIQDTRRFWSRKQQAQRFHNTETQPEDFQESNSQRLTTSEYELLWCVFHYNWVAQAVSEVIDNDWIDTDTIEGKLLSRILAEHHEGLWDGIENMDLLLENEEEKNFAYGILAKNLDVEDPVREVNQCIKGLLDKFAHKRIDQIRVEIANLPTPSDQHPRLAAENKTLLNLVRNAPVVTLPAD